MLNAQKLFLYARKSTDDRDKQVQSILDQIAELRAFAHKEGVSVVEVLVEKQSAKQPGRKVFEAMLQRIAKGEAEGILSWHPDRLARNFTDGARVIEMIETYGAELHFPSYSFDNTPHGIFCLSLAFGQSKLYVDNLSENVKRGQRNKAKRGILPRYAPTGYINNRNTREIDPDPEYAPLVVSLFEQYSTGRYTLKQLGWKNRNGNPCAVSGVQKILRNPFYYGLIVWGGETYEGVHKPLITKKLFDQCQAVMKQRGRIHTKHEPKQYPFRQLLKCAHCGCSITSSIAKKRYVYYHCTRKKGNCGTRFLSPKAIDEQVRLALQTVSLTPADAKSIETHLRKLHETDIQAGASRTETLRSGIREINEKLDTLLDMSLSGDISREEYILKKQKLLAKKTDLREKSRRISDGGASWLEPALSILNQATTIPNALKSPNPTERVNCFKEVGSNRTLRGKTVVFQPQCGWSALYDGLQGSPSTKAYSCVSTDTPSFIRRCG